MKNVIYDFRPINISLLQYSIYLFKNNVYLFLKKTRLVQIVTCQSSVVVIFKDGPVGHTDFLSLLPATQTETGFKIALLTLTIEEGYQML